MPKSKNIQELDFDEFRNMAFKLTDPDEAALAKQILGENFNGFKAVVNAVGKAAEEPSSNFAILALRGKEIALPLTGAGLVGAGAFANLPVVALGGAAVLLSPIMMAKIVTNPRRVNIFLGLQNKKLIPEKLIQKALVLANDIYKEMDEDEKDALADSMNPLNLLEDDDDNQEEQ